MAQTAHAPTGMELEEMLLIVIIVLLAIQLIRQIVQKYTQQVRAEAIRRVRVPTIAERTV